MESTPITISQADRKLLQSALCALDREILGSDGSDAVRAEIERLRQMLAPAVSPVAQPPHVSVDVAELASLMAVLPNAESWRLTLDREEGSGHALLAEASAGDAVWEFRLATGLKGTGRFFELVEADQSFFREIETLIQDNAALGSQIVHEVVELALPWEFMPDDDIHLRIEEYLSGFSESGEIMPALHSTYIDIHSDEEVDRLGYASVMTEISGFEDELDDARRIIGRANERAKSEPSLST